MIKTESLKFSYDGKKYFDFPDINLDSGENLLIIGNSGIGKTTLLHLLAGILKPESGSINISGRDISKFSDTELDKFRGDNILDSLNIKDKYQQKPNQLSEGEKQRASIALALINSPSLILADEPTSSLDDFNCDNVIKILKKQAKDHKAQLIVITHDARLKKHFKNNLNL